jgi:hypothetical protein
LAADPAGCVDQRILIAGTGARRLDAVGIFLGIAELERVFAHLRGGQPDIYTAIIEHLRKAFVRADAAMMLALRADRLVFLIFLDEDHLRAAGHLCQSVLVVSRLDEGRSPCGRG